MDKKRAEELEWMFSEMREKVYMHTSFAKDITPENSKLLSNVIILNEVWETLGLSSATLTTDITHKFDVHENQQELSAIIAELFGCTVEQAAVMLEICTKPDETAIKAFENYGDNLSIDLVRGYRRCRIKNELGIEIKDSTVEVEGPTK